MRFTPPDYFLVFVGLEILFHFFFPLKNIIFFPFIYLGIPFVVLGLYLNFIWVYFTFKKEKTTVNPYENPSKLVTYGIFKFSRNPTYLGMALTLVGVAVLLGSLAAFIFPIIFIILTNVFVIPLEEKNLERQFGKKYLDYKKKVRRWI